MGLEEKLTARINFLLGKNGCGKSTVLRELDNRLSKTAEWFVRYITPERGGSLTYDANVTTNIASEPAWLNDTRRNNRFDMFRQQTMAQFLNLKVAVLEEIEQDPKVRGNLSYTFQAVVDQINELLPLVSLVRSSSGFEIRRNADGKRIDAAMVSSGESEAIALAIEALVFSRDSQGRAPARRLLLIDEPDVHLHPDLQGRYARFLEKLAKEKDFKVLIATHSTAMLGSIDCKDECQIAFMPITKGTATEASEIKFSTVDDITTAVLPVFGAHPLSNTFNENPVMLVEGDDDKRIWDQVVRCTAGRVRLYPCPTGSKDRIGSWETWLVEKLPSLYDAPRAFSLRDRDDDKGELEDRPPVLRFRLACRAAENMILADDTLQLAGTNWDKVKEGCRKWLDTYPQHPRYDEMKIFADGGFDRFNAKLKGLRNILVAILGVSRPWEVLVGQAISTIVSMSSGADTLAQYLGKKVCTELLNVKPLQQ